MLSKPGEARSKATASTPSSRRRKVAEENLEDVVRKLQRLPCNKVCADCQSKLPQCVNLSHGTFICMACSGVHREFSHKIKGIGHSSFTPEEVAMLRHPHSGNEAVNARYLAKYSSSHDRIRPPKDNSDLHALRAWIQRKYVDKAWFRDLTESADEGKRLPSATPQTAPPGRRKILPNVSSGAAAHAQSGDLFGFDSIAPSSLSAGNDSWDAFGSSSLQTQQRQPQVDAKPQAFADFGSASSFQPDFASIKDNVPPPAPYATPSFPAEFDTTSWQAQAQQPTVVALPPPPPPGQDSFANFDQPQARQPAFEANFTQQQPMFRANFDQPSLHTEPAPKKDAHTPKNAVTTTTTNRMNNNADNFQPDFDQISMSNQSSLGLNPQTGMPQPPNNKTVAMTNQETDHFGTFEANFDDADSAFPVQQAFGGGMNFGNFVQSQGINIDASLQQQHQQPTPIPQMNALPGEGTGMMKQPQVPVESNVANPNVNKPMEAPAPPTTPANQQESNPASLPLNPNAFRSVEEDKLSAFDAFEGLSLEPTPVLMETSGAMTGVSRVTSNGGSSSGLGGGNAMGPIPDTLKAAKLQETIMMLQYLSLEQLLQVQQYISSLGSTESETMAHSYGGGVAMAVNGHAMMGSIPNQHPVSGMGSVGLNGVVSSNPDMSMPMGGTIHFNGQPSMSQFQQFSSPQIQPMGMGVNTQNDKMPEPSATNVPVPAALPPVEKEGNPFDMY